MLKIIRNLLVSGVSFFAAIGPAQAQRDIEQPSYDVLKQSDGVELRRYAPHIVAEVTVEAGSMRQASSEGFRSLAGYIFGYNQGAEKIAMTAPVTTQAQSEGTQIAMTAPVTTSEDKDGTYTIRFSMPSEWTMATLPKPKNDKVELKQIDTEKRVVYPLVGDRSGARLDEAQAKIDAFLKREKLKAVSSTIIAGYDGPNVPTKNQRWEVMRIVS